jgi:hypothetical protein
LLRAGNVIRGIAFAFDANVPDVADDTDDLVWLFRVDRQALADGATLRRQRSASVREMMTTGAAETWSADENPRPDKSGMPITSK